MDEAGHALSVSMKLKNLNQSIPGGFIWVQRETGWDNRKQDPPSQWDIRRLVTSLQKHRTANKGRFPWFKTDYQSILNEVEQVNVERIAKKPGAGIYLSDSSPPKTSALSSLPQKLESAVAGLKRVNAGRKMLLEWERESFPLVPQETANLRAIVCAECPKNGKGDFTAYFTVPASNRIKQQIEVLKERKIDTPLDEKLGVCEICLCPLKLKVHAPMEYVERYMSDEIRAELAAVTTDKGKCWVVAK